MDSLFRAAFMSAATGASSTYDFQADSGLFQLPADHIVRRFMDHMNEESDWVRPLSYELNSVVKKPERQVVMATGSLLLEKGDPPFLLMISPEPRTPTANGYPS
jgi:hypothetical protein